MIVETGHFALILALALACFNAVVPLWGVATRDSRLMGTAPVDRACRLWLRRSVLCALTYAHITSDFSLLNVYENSASAKPLIYKITGVWGNHEGSMLLWVLILAVFAAAVALSARAMPQDLHAAVLAVQSWISAAFLLLSCSHPIHSRASPIRRSRGRISIRCCKTPVSRSTRRCSISAMWGFRLRLPSRRARSSVAVSMRSGRGWCGRGR